MANDTRKCLFFECKRRILSIPIRKGVIVYFCQTRSDL